MRLVPILPGAQWRGWYSMKIDNYPQYKAHCTRSMWETNSLEGTSIPKAVGMTSLFEGWIMTQTLLSLPCDITVYFWHLWSFMVWRQYMDIFRRGQFLSFNCALFWLAWWKSHVSQFHPDLEVNLWSMHARHTTIPTLVRGVLSQNPSTVVFQWPQFYSIMILTWEGSDAGTWMWQRKPWCSFKWKAENFDFIL
jgi:hypothetical protein